MNNRRECARGKRRRHPRKISFVGRRHALNIESCKSPPAASEVEEADDPTSLFEPNSARRVNTSRGPNSPRIGEEGWSNPETDDIRERVEFFAEIAVGTHRSRHAAIEGIEEKGNTDRYRSLIEIGSSTFKRREDRIISAHHVCYGEKGG